MGLTVLTYSHIDRAEVSHVLYKIGGCLGAFAVEELGHDGQARETLGASVGRDGRDYLVAVRIFDSGGAA